MSSKGPEAGQVVAIFREAATNSSKRKNMFNILTLFAFYKKQETFNLKYVFLQKNFWIKKFPRAFNLEGGVAVAP